VVLFYWDFNLHFPKGKLCHVSFHLFLYHHLSFLWKCQFKSSTIFKIEFFSYWVLRDEKNILDTSSLWAIWLIHTVNLSSLWIYYMWLQPSVAQIIINKKRLKKIFKNQNFKLLCAYYASQFMWRSSQYCVIVSFVEIVWSAEYFPTLTLWKSSPKGNSYLKGKSYSNPSKPKWACTMCNLSDKVKIWGFFERQHVCSGSWEVLRQKKKKIKYPQLSTELCISWTLSFFLHSGLLGTISDHKGLLYFLPVRAWLFS
jgi:hypothetical protein